MIVRWVSIAVLSFVCALAPHAAEPAPPTRLPPVDEAAKDPSFVQFRNELKDVIASKDAAKLFHYLASDIRISFGGGSGDYGGPEFHKMWKPFDKDTKVWKALGLVVDNGGKFVLPRAFAAPYVYAAFPEDYDSHTSVAVTNPNAVLRDQPNASAKVIRKLAHDLLTVQALANYDLILVGSDVLPQHTAHPNAWLLVKNVNGPTQGWVLNMDVRSPIDYRIIFENRKGKWMIATFVAGE